jgi:hypothetical protein
MGHRHWWVLSCLFKVIFETVYKASALEIIDHNFTVNKSLHPDVSLMSTELNWEQELPEIILPHVNGTARHFDLIMYVLSNTK